MRVIFLGGSYLDSHLSGFSLDSKANGKEVMAEILELFHEIYLDTVGLTIKWGLPLLSCHKAGLASALERSKHPNVTEHNVPTLRGRYDKKLKTISFTYKGHKHLLMTQRTGESYRFALIFPLETDLKDDVVKIIHEHNESLKTKSP